MFTGILIPNSKVSELMDIMQEEDNEEPTTEHFTEASEINQVKNLASGTDPAENIYKASTSSAGTKAQSSKSVVKNGDDTDTSFVDTANEDTGNEDTGTESSPIELDDDSDEDFVLSSRSQHRNVVMSKSKKFQKACADIGLKSLKRQLDEVEEVGRSRSKRCKREVLDVDEVEEIPLAARRRSKRSKVDAMSQRIRSLVKVSCRISF